MMAARGVSRSPNVLLADTMPVRAIPVLSEGARPIARTDQGVRCHRGGWIDRMDGHGLVRLMLRKARGRENVAAEEFFGRLEVGMHGGAGWEGRTAAELEAGLAEHMD